MAIIFTPGQLDRRADFYYQLLQLTNAGIGLIQGLEQLRRAPPDKTFRKPLDEIIEHLHQGETFGEALVSSRKWLPDLDIALLRAAEASGRLPDCFRLLSDQYRDQAALSRKLLATIAYPVFIFHFAVLIFPISAWQGLILQGDYGNYLRQKLSLLLPIYALIFALIYGSQSSRGHGWRSALELVLLPIPLLGRARRSLALARLAAALEGLTSAGINIIEAWQMAAEASGSPALWRAVIKAKPQLLNGLAVSETLADSPEFPELFVNLYRTGEISGQLDDALMRLRIYYQEEGSRYLKRFFIGAAGVLAAVVMSLVAWQIISFWMGYFERINEVIP